MCGQRPIWGSPEVEAPVQPWVSGKVVVTIEQVSVQTQIALSYFCLLRK